MKAILVAALLLSGDFCFSQLIVPDSAHAGPLFEDAAAMAIDPRGDIYVVDAGKNQLLKLSSRYTLTGSAGGYGWSTLAFDQPKDVVAPNGLDVYVADYGNHRIQRLDRNLNFVSTIPPTVTRDIEPAFRYPRSAAVSRQGALFVTDGENGRILKYVNNIFERSFGNIGAGDGRLRQPSRIRIDNRDIVYVRDGNLLLTYDYFGNYLSSVGRGLFRQLITFTIDRDVVYVVDTSMIYAMRPTGQVDTLTAYQKMARSTEYPAVDIAVYKDTLFLLTVHTISLKLPLRAAHKDD